MTLVLNTGTTIVADVVQRSKSYHNCICKIELLEDGAYTVTGDAMLVDFIDAEMIRTSDSLRHFMMSDKLADHKMYKLLSSARTTLVLVSPNWSGHLQCRKEGVYSYEHCFEPEGSGSHYINHLRPVVEAFTSRVPFLADTPHLSAKLTCLQVIDVVLRDYFLEEMRMMVWPNQIVAHRYDVSRQKVTELRFKEFVYEVYRAILWLAAKDTSVRVSNAYLSTEIKGNSPGVENGYQ